jgi:tetratricopeptide (TPR) repeat protein
MPFELAFRFRSAGYLDWAAKSSGVAVIPRVDFPFATEADRETMPRLVLGSPYRVQLNTEIELPPGYTIQPGVPVTTANAGFTYTSAYEASGRRLVVRRELSSTLREIPSQRFAEYSALIVAAKADFDQRPRVIGTMTEMPPVPDDATASELYSAAYNAFQAKKYKAAAMLWKRTTDVDPKMRSAWDSLGLAYDELGEYDEAIAAVQKQIELDRFDKRAYGDLGRIYQHATKGELAVKAYTRHLELNPLDGDVLKALGLLYWDLNRYSEAATTLEKASPLLKDGWMQAVLGSAYLRLHRQADARKAFDRAVELDSKAAVLAKVGWEMATAGVDLDRAGDLLARAEKQIAQSTEQLDVENVKPEHLDAMERIAWCWDGRAWIDFQRGNLAEAERYAQAAWLLGGEPEMAYHLGRVYEKRSRLADAMNYYLTAQATASDPTPEMIAHVKSLAGGGDLKLMLDSARRLASSDRIVQLPEKLFDGSADFLVVVGPDRHAVDVTFRSGTDALRSIDGALRQVQYPIAFPDDTRLRLALGVHVICERAHGCLAAVAFPRTVRLTE